MPVLPYWARVGLIRYAGCQGDPCGEQSERQVEGIPQLSQARCHNGDRGSAAQEINGGVPKVSATS